MNGGSLEPSRRTDSGIHDVCSKTFSLGAKEAEACPRHPVRTRFLGGPEKTLWAPGLLGARTVAGPGDRVGLGDPGSVLHWASWTHFPAVRCPPCACFLERCSAPPGEERITMLCGAPWYPHDPLLTFPASKEPPSSVLVQT